MQPTMRRASLWLALASPALCRSIATLAPTPLVIWHGLGDTYDADGLESVGDLARKANPGTYVYNIRLSDDSSEDRQATYFGNLTTQLEQVCDALANHPVLSLAPTINALGFSQGGQFLRGFVERCNKPPVRALVTFGSQHNGIAQFKDCAATDWLCQAAYGLLQSNVWSDFVQSRLVPAQYFRNPDDLDSYRAHSNFLADLNNEAGGEWSTGYAKRMASLDMFAMYLFTEDDAVIPKESAWFADVNSTTGKVTPLRERDLYNDDRLGLKSLDDGGRLHFRSAKGGHMQLSEELLVDVFKTYFGPGDPRGGKDDAADQMSLEL